MLPGNAKGVTVRDSLMILWGATVVEECDADARTDGPVAGVA